MSFMKGQVLSFKSKGKNIRIHWSQGGVLGFGGERRQRYNLCEYATESGEPIAVYIQEDYDIKEELTVDSSLQYGIQEGVLFFVYHDQSQTPYQIRFKQDGLSRFASDILKGIDQSTLTADYLINVE